MKRTRLVSARLERGWSQEETAGRMEVARGTYIQWETGKAAPYPTHVKRLCDLFGMSVEDLDLAISIPAFSGCIEGIEQGIASVRSLSDAGTATQILRSYEPILTSLLETSQQIAAAALLSQLYQELQNHAYHIGGIEKVIYFSEKAVDYARIANDSAQLVTSLCHVGRAHEWPIQGIAKEARLKKGLGLLEEAVSLLGAVTRSQRASVSIYHAKFLALNGRKQEAYNAMGDAREHFDQDERSPDFTEVNLIRQTAIAHSYLREQDQAIAQFMRLFDVETPDVTPILPMRPRTRISATSELLFSLLKTADKDQELTVHLWKALFAQAQELKSATYMKEAAKTYEIMECVWPDDTEVLALSELLYA